MVFPHKLFFCDYFFVYASDDNNVVVLIHPNQDGADKTEAEILDYEVVDNMGYDIMEAME